MRARVVGQGEGPVRRIKVVTRSACGKFAYTTKKLAKANAVVQTKASGEAIEAYHCYRCHAYHIGHVPKPHIPAA